MTLKARWIISVNFRETDQMVLEAANEIALREDTSLTEILRTALRQYVDARTYTLGSTKKMDEFLDRINIDPQYLQLLTPSALKGWEDTQILSFARQLRARKEEISFELKRRGYLFDWR